MASSKSKPSLDNSAGGADLNKKVRQVFGALAIDKRRLPASQLQKRGVPAYVGEWIIDTLVPSENEFSPEQAHKVQDWASRNIPAATDSNLIKHKLLDGEMVKMLTPVQVEVVLTKQLQERVAKMNLLGIGDAQIQDTLVQEYPDLLNQGMWGVVELILTKTGV